MFCRHKSVVFLFAGWLIWIAPARAGVLDTIGVTALQNADPTLTGTGIRAAQPEAYNPVSPDWEVDPVDVNQPTSLFTWTSSAGSTNDFPNALGQVSGHADQVGNNFYTPGTGVAPGLASVDNYDATYFINTIVPDLMSIRAPVVNQSYNVTSSLPDGAAMVESQYDKYVAMFNTVFASGVGNGGPPMEPSTAYNVLSVGAYGGSSSIGPTTNGGRAKPDITAPAGATSYSTPYVSGAAVLLLQSAARNDAGPGTAATATNYVTLKALLLNAAVKPPDWTNGAASPLDARYGAGIVNVYNSWLQLLGGKRPYIESTSVGTGASHPPGSNPNNIAVLRGWDQNTSSCSLTTDGVNHYYFQLSAAQSSLYSLTATLIWNRHEIESSINTLDLFLYDTANNNLVASCQSSVDNVQHIFLPNLSAGRYDLQVLQQGGSSMVTSTETYAVAFDFEPAELSIALADTNALVSWPASGAGFTLQTSTDLTGTGNWSDASATAVQTNGQYVVEVPASGASQFFRLVGP
jgi:hypothetical protein